MNRLTHQSLIKRVIPNIREMARRDMDDAPDALGFAPDHRVCCPLIIRGHVNRNGRLTALDIKFVMHVKRRHSPGDGMPIRNRIHSEGEWRGMGNETTT